MKRKTANVLGVLLCWALAFIGVLFYWTHKDAAFYTGKYGSPVTEELDRVEFGADFYTYSYEASAYAANGIRNIYRALVEAISAVFFVGGSIGIYFLVHNWLQRGKRKSGDYKLKERERPRGRLCMGMAIIWEIRSHGQRIERRRMINRTDARKYGNCQYCTGNRIPAFDRNGNPKAGTIERFGNCKNEKSIRFCGQKKLCSEHFFKGIEIV